ncbi:hypothetical protein A3715_34155 [Oleiphilus sp. HI0009]|nr:hypothetical protein A3715_34155 [Oleiphilus sp. HI0009]
MEFRADTEFASDNLTGIYNIAFSLEQGESNGISQPEFLRQVESFSQWLKSKPEVTNVETITEIFKRLNKNMHADNQDFFMLPEDKELAAQYLLLYEMSLPYGLDLNNQLNIDKSSARILISLENVDTRTTLRLEQEISQWLEDNTDIESFYAASTNLMFSHIGKRNVDSMIMGVCYALIVIIIVMCIVLRSLRLGAVSIIPNLVPIGATFGIWGLFQGDKIIVNLI